MNQEPTKTQILRVISSYLETISEQEGAPEKQGGRVAVAAVKPKASRGKASRRSHVSHALYGTVWCVWGVVLTVFLYVAQAPVSAYIIAWAILCYGVYQLLRSIPLAFR